MSKERSKRPTVRDVAAVAGVGTMTVSRVVNNVGYVSAKTRERVERAIAQTGYVPNHQARGLRNRRSGTIALIVSDVTNPYFTTIARGVEDAFRPHGSLILIVSTDEEESTEVHSMRLLVQKGVEGILLVPSHNGSEAIGIAKEHGIPCVIVDRRAPEGVDSVRCDSEAGAFELGALLRSNGHRSVGILAAVEGVSTSDDRVRGFVAGFAESAEKITVSRGRFTIEQGYNATLALLQGSDKPTSIFATNNFLSIGALRAIHDLGLECPRDISLVGFDDLPEAMLAHPVLTVVSQPARELGIAAAELLMKRIAEPLALPTEVILPSSLLIRKSVALLVRPS